jgi:FAD/FMN-containing dehydrogenase
MPTVDPQPPVPDELRNLFRGSVVGSADPDYDEARSVWNGMIDRRPLAIVRAADLDDVRAGIRLARDRGLPLAIRGGGHNVAGNATVDAGIVLDLGGLKVIDVDPGSTTVRVDPGVTLGDIDRATERYGLAVPMGVVSQTGIAGLTLGGGFGWLVRAHGLTVDNLIAADVMTAAGELTRATETENADLFWGLKGGGGNFGVVTSFTFRAHPLPPKIFGGNLIYEQTRWHEALVAWRDWTAKLDDRMTSIISFLVPPPELEMGDRALMLLGFAWSGPDHDEGERILSPLRTAAPADTELIEPTRWVEWQSASDAFLSKGVRAYWKNAFFQALDDRMIDTLIEHASAQTWLGTGTDLHHMGGAFGRVPEAATPFPNRSANYWLNIYGFWADATDDDHHSAWVRSLHGAATPHSMAGAYVNALAHDGDRANPRQLAEAAYGPEKLERLITLKRKYDPENLFRLNHNIPPD